MNLAMDQFEALRGYTADSYQRDMDQAAADVLGLGDIADNVISAADEEVEDAMRTAAWNKAEAEWQAEKEDC